MQRDLAVLLVVCSAFGNVAYSQQLTSPSSAVAPAGAPVAVSAPASVGPDASGRYMLRDGTDVNLVFAQDLSSKTASEGDPVMLTLVDDLTVGNVVVAKAGDKAVGEVTKAEKSGMMGKAGELNIR